MAGILLVAVNLRAPITSVGPLLDGIQSSTGISGGAAGLVTTLPLVAFGLLSLVASGLGRRFGVERVLFGALLILVLGIALRSTPTLAALFSGTFVVGVAIALGNVLLPVLIKRDLPARAGLLTGMYTATMSTVAALASGVSVPLAQGTGLGWRWALALWAVPALVAAALWLPRARKASPAADASAASRRPPGGLWRSPLAWQVTLFMGLQSVVFYVCITWLPAIVREDGLSASQAGWMVFLMQIVGIPASLVAPVIAERFRSQRLPLVAAASASGAGLLGLMLSGGAATPLWAAFLGLGQGSCISLALTLFALRAPDAGRAAELSSMAQSVGYLLAAAGPAAFGLLYDVSGGWTAPLAALLAVTVCLAASGIGAGRDARVAPSE